MNYNFFLGVVLVLVALNLIVSVAIFMQVS